MVDLLSLKSTTVESIGPELQIHFSPEPRNPKTHLGVPMQLERSRKSIETSKNKKSTKNS
uniref:Uncharacterized protein n=1 Tax=Nelumbo nucifera TaxID=4432 RepID=A0A822XKN5_NELNU|nr:TPA_asm: hypothetical protein HUJ06_022035 [Nelumbo nucifera]